MNISDSAHPTGPSPRPSAATLEFREATKRYPGQSEPAVESLSLTVPAGEICVLVGPSGCGKTTAMRMVNRMIDITDGDILLDGQSVRERRPGGAAARHRLRDPAGRAVPAPDRWPTTSPPCPRLLGWDRDRIRARVDELLELVSLDPSETRDRYPAQLSGGQRQRVGVARALAVDPPLMLMDEPFGAIDPINRERLQNEFLRLQREIRKTVVFVTHDIDEAIKMGDRIAVLQKGGKLAQYAPPAELLMQPANAFVEDFVGADRALKRLALQRVRDVDLWKAPLVRVGEPVAEARGKARRRRRCPTRCSWTTRAARSAGCPSAPCRASGSATSCARGPTRCSRWTTSCATRSPDLLAEEAQYGAGRGRARGRDRRALDRDPEPRPEDGPGSRSRAERTRCEPAARPGRDPRAHRGHLRVRQRLLPGLDRRQLRPLRGPVLPARAAHGGGGGDRLPDRIQRSRSWPTGGAG